MNTHLADNESSMKTQLSTDRRPRCWRCGRVLAELVTRPWSVKCQRCKALCSNPP